MEKYYKVHYSQVNQQYIIVEAEDKENAIRKADRIAKGEFPNNDEEPIEISKKEFDEFY